MRPPRPCQPRRRYICELHITEDRSGDNSGTFATVATMRVTRSAVTRTCAICERSLLMGEHAIRFSPDGGEYVDVCPLCAEIALEHGWVREGSPSVPAV